MDKTTRETAKPQESRPWSMFHTRSYAESYKSRHKKYPIGYDPDNPDPEIQPEGPRTVEAAIVAEVAKAAPFKGVTKECPAYYINSQLANCDEITNGNMRLKMTHSTVKYLALLNLAMKKKNYTWVSDEQLVAWMRMKFKSWQNMEYALRKVGAFVVVGEGSNSTWRVIRPDLPYHPARAEEIIKSFTKPSII